ncbi:putative bifunctional diguanylate cyclase/phosphodiesterase [Rhodovulum visakhapatnamense]|uniref:Bifunctional diguanylate cyclase/phosphodiesterase n=1 Tax=Rhodovulum visakhapatnamense TaxID=364297 RepID=A0ABS1RJ71_9RHOB|nr:bifunctional diguanylate cyclase/phosphodiesterase [Rhodovulum visakhapatnamense]MBL3571370.1 bifunctional diguanylate cyclase/phosphodiesterase [Rhodovulum visakhapatnamense]MBL3579700.1 bifunctional diguanylate cyclase/phosphodiesterase [Rhodovulum visakhapatnamense]
MRSEALPPKIMAASILFIATFSGVLWASFISIVDTTNRDAAKQSKVLMSGRIGAYQEQLALIASDYNNWTDVYLAAENLDLKKLSTNYGITAVRGDVFQYAEMFDGPFAEPIAWFSGGTLQPGPSLFDEEVRNALRRHVADLNQNTRETYEFFMNIRGKIVIFSASYLLPEFGEFERSNHGEKHAIAMVGKVLTQEALLRVADELSVRDIHFTTEYSTEALPSISLLGPDEAPIASLSWNAPEPGTNLFAKMWKILAAATAALAAVTILAAAVVNINIRKLVRKECEAADLARTDNLTGLANRLYLLERMEALLQMPGHEVVALVLDLNRFKQVNDVVGHAGGDALLKSFASRLNGFPFRNSFCARTGGDEFVIVFWGESRLLEAIKKRASWLQSVCSRPISCLGFEFDISVSKGLAITHNGQLSAQEVLRRADRAMYHAKTQGLQRLVIFDDEMERTDHSNRKIERSLRESLTTDGHFFVEYQPIVSASDPSKLIRVEALARWRDDSGDIVSPSEFIGIAEVSNLIVPLGWKILDIVCLDLARNPGISASVNVSAIQLMSPSFASSLTTRVLRSGVEPERIELEITETVALQDTEVVVDQVRRLVAAGFSVALDDFGTGYSSVGYIRKIPFSTLKIDKSFAIGGIGGGENEALIEGIVSLSHALGVEVVAEGVERVEDFIKLNQIGCDYIQGFLVGRPTSLEVALDGISKSCLELAMQS